MDAFRVTLASFRNSRISIMANPSITKSHQAVSTEPVLPAREQALIDELRDPTLGWSISRSQDRQIWESGGEKDPSLNPIDDTHVFGGMTSRRSTIGRGGVTHRINPYKHIDWHSSETETLRATTDSHEIEFSKTHVDSYTHRLRQGMNITQFRATFVNIQDRDQRVVIDNSAYPGLERIFHEISKTIN